VTRESGRLVLLGVIGLVFTAAWVIIGSTREAGDDRRELPRQVEFRIDGALIEGWTLSRPSCPDFGAAEEGAEINCSALATNSGGQERAANVAVRIAHCNSNVVAGLMGQDETRDCSYDFTYTIHQARTTADDS
jgi:hypothetical protein